MEKVVQNAEMVTVSANVRTVRTFEYTAEDAEVAKQLGILVDASIDDRITRAVVSYNMAARLAIEAGYLLLSIKAEVDHGQFGEALESMEMTRQRAAELMRMAKFTTMIPQERRSELMVMPKAKVLVLASADPEVVEELLEEGGDVNPADLSVRALRSKVRELEKKAADAVVDRSTAEAEAESLRKKLAAQAHQPAAGVMPVVIKDIRAEITALLKKAELSVESLVPIETELAGLRWSAVDEWVNPSGQLLMAGLVALRLQLDGAIDRIAEKLEMTAQALKDPNAMAGLDKFEVAEIAGVYQGLIRTHEYEAAMRQYERDQERPRSKGRPKAEPKSPE